MKAESRTWYSVEKIAKRDPRCCASKIFRMINNAQDFNDLQIALANRLEKLKGDLKEYYSIRINNHWRTIFKWVNNDAYELRTVDYH